MRLKRKLKNQSGFSLAETLLAVLILLLVSAIVASGIPVARNVYNNVIVGANAQVLLSTAVTALRNELGTARDVQQDGTAAITYYNPAIRSYSRISTDGSSGTIQVQPYLTLTEPHQPLSDSTPHDLVSKAASNGNLYITYTAVAPDSNDASIIVFKSLEVRRITGNALITSLNELKIRTFSEPSSDA